MSHYHVRLLKPAGAPDFITEDLAEALDCTAGVLRAEWVRRTLSPASAAGPPATGKAALRALMAQGLHGIEQSGGDGSWYVISPGGAATDGPYPDAGTAQSWADWRNAGCPVLADLEGRMRYLAGIATAPREERPPAFRKGSLDEQDAFLLHAMGMAAQKVNTTPGNDVARIASCNGELRLAVINGEKSALCDKQPEGPRESHEE